MRGSFLAPTPLLTHPVVWKKPNQNMSKPSIEELVTHCDLPGISILDVEIVEKFYDDIVKCLSDWECVARKFEIDTREIDESYPKSKDRKVRFLIEWKSRNSVNATYKELVTSLWKSDLTNDARNICEVYKSESLI